MNVNFEEKQKGACLITGASSGLGEAFAFVMAEEGFPLILTARRENVLKKLRARLIKKYPELPVAVFPADLGKNDQLEDLLLQLEDRQISVVINNAGFGHVGRLLSMSEEESSNMNALNVNAMHRITVWAAKRFEKQGSGSLLNVASSAGLITAGPYMAQYYATKAYTVSLTLGLAEELRREKSPVYIGCLCPGPVNTAFNDRAGVTTPLSGISAKACVRYAVSGMKQNKSVIIPTLYMKIALTGGRLLPRNALVRMTGSQQKKKMKGRDNK